MAEYSTFGSSGTSKNAQVVEEVKNQFALANAQHLLQVRLVQCLDLDQVYC